MHFTASSRPRSKSPMEQDEDSTSPLGRGSTTTPSSSPVTETSSVSSARFSSERDFLRTPPLSGMERLEHLIKLMEHITAMRRARDPPSPDLCQPESVDCERSFASDSLGSKGSKKRLVPRWARVKEALGLERGTLSDKSVLSPELADSLGIPVYSDMSWGAGLTDEEWFMAGGGLGVGPDDSGSPQETSPSWLSKSSPALSEDPGSKSPVTAAGKKLPDTSKSTWRRVKTMIQTRRDSLKQRRRRRPSPGEGCSEKSGCYRKEEDFEETSPTNLLQELKRNVSEDFTKKMVDWERMKQSGRAREPPQGAEETKRKHTKKDLQSEDTRRSKDVSWLEKELQKVEGDLNRLGKERQKVEKRSARLQQLREAMAKSQESHEVLVRTAAGEFRFKGISGDFTRKLYEWETKRGVNPELSTIALLEPTAGDTAASTPTQDDGKGYYSLLLQENVTLLAQLRAKEDICKRLQKELQSLDDRTEEMNNRHQHQMERYRTKLWEIHQEGCKSRDFQSAFKLIAELKSRIEELQRCSDKLKSDREALEESFRYHSDQQARLADDLINKMKELQAVGGEQMNGSRPRSVVQCDPAKIEHLHHITTLLLEQARDVERSLAEKSRQVCRLQWELLHREVLSRSELPVSSARARRRRWAARRAWSAGEGRRAFSSEDEDDEGYLPPRLAAEECPRVDYAPSDLLSTVQELQRAVLRLEPSPSPPPQTPGLVVSEDAGSEPYPRLLQDSEDSEMESAAHSRSSSFSSEVFSSPRPSLSGSWDSSEPESRPRGGSGLYVLSSSMPRLPGPADSALGVLCRQSLMSLLAVRRSEDRSRSSSWLPDVFRPS